MSSAIVSLPISLRRSGVFSGRLFSSSGVKVRRRLPRATRSPYEMDLPRPCTAPSRAVHAAAGTPRSRAPASRRATRPAAPARLYIGKSCHTEKLAPVSISPHRGAESTVTTRTLLQSASNSSATIRASAVQMCWPISARAEFTVTIPAESIEYQMVGSNAGAAAAPRAAASAPRAYPRKATAPAICTRNSRRVGPRPPRSATVASVADACGRDVDGLADPRVRHAPAEVAGHAGVDVLVGGVGIVAQKSARLHDLSRLAVTALRDLLLAPGNLQGMLALGVEPFDGRDARARHRGDRRDARSRRAPVDVHRARSAEPDPAAKLRAGEPELVADDPEQGRVVGAPCGDLAPVELELRHADDAPLQTVS